MGPGPATSNESDQCCMQVQELNIRGPVREAILGQWHVVGLTVDQGCFQRLDLFAYRRILPVDWTCCKPFAKECSTQ